MAEKTDFNNYLDHIAESGMAKTQKWATMWSESLRYAFSDQLHGRKKRKKWDWVVLNYVWPAMMNEIAKLTKNPAKLGAEPWEKSDMAVSVAWQGMLNFLWQQGINTKGMRIDQIMAIFDCQLFGYCVSRYYWEPKSYWDDDAQQWVGDVKHRLWHPAHFWAEDDECIDDGHCGTERWVDVEWAVSRWPKHEKAIKEAATKYEQPRGGWSAEHIRGQLAGGAAGSGEGGQDRGDFGSVKPSILLDLITGADKMTASQDESERELVRIQEFFLKDYSEDKVKVEEDVSADELIASGQIYSVDGVYKDTDTNEVIMPEQWPKRTLREYDRPRFPKGRYVMRIGDTILNPKDQKYPYSRWPFIIKPHYMLPHMWQGIDGVQMYKSTQDMINVSVSHLFNNMKQFGDPRIAVEDWAVPSDPKRRRKSFSFAAGAGAILRLAKGAIKSKGFEIVPPQQISAGHLQLYALFQQEYKNIQGLQSIAKGEKIPGKMTATEAQMLAVSSVDRIALQNVFEEEWVRQSAILIAEICQKNYDIERYVRVLGEDGVLGATQITQRMKSVRFDVNVRKGTMMPFDEERKLQKMLQAYELVGQGVPNPMLPDVLRELGVMNWQEILQKHEAYQIYLQLLQLYQGVREGKIQPEEARDAITQKAMQMFATEMANPVARNA